MILSTLPLLPTLSYPSVIASEINRDGLGTTPPIYQPSQNIRRSIHKPFPHPETLVHWILWFVEVSIVYCYQTFRSIFYSSLIILLGLLSFASFMLVALIRHLTLLLCLLLILQLHPPSPNLVALHTLSYILLQLAAAVYLVIHYSNRAGVTSNPQL